MTGKAEIFHAKESDMEKINSRLDHQKHLIEGVIGAVNDLNTSFQKHVANEEAIMTSEIRELADFVKEYKEVTKYAGKIGCWLAKQAERLSKAIRWLMVVVAPFAFLWYWFTQDLKHAVQAFKGWFP